MSMRSWISGVAACSVALSAAAQDSTLTDDEIVVTATRVPTPVDEVLPSTILIDRETIDRSLAVDAADLLKFHAGLDVARNGGPGQSTSVFIRGADSNHTLVMVDGVRINPGTIGIPALQNLTPELIDRIEVVKGPRSSLYGTDAIGGVINVITRRGSREGWSAELGYGDDDTREASLNGGLAGRAGAVDIGLAWIESDGFPTVSDRAVSDIDRGYDNFSANVQARTQLGSAEVTLRRWQSSGRTEYFDFFLAPVDQDFDDSTTSLGVVLPAGRDATLALTGSYFEDEIEQRQVPDYLRTHRYALDAQYDRALGEHHALTAGTLLSDENAESLSFGTFFDEDTRITNVFVQDRLQYGRQRGTLALAYTDHETFGSEVTWNVDYGFAFTNATELVLAAGTGFRAPDATDRFGFGGNPDLDPEHSQSYSAELRHRAGDRHAFRLAAFENDIDDLIEYVSLPPPAFFGARNVAETRTRGIEAGYDYTGENWHLNAAATLQDPENRETGETLLRRAKQSYTVSAVREFGRFDLGVDALASGERRDISYDGSEMVTLDSYVLVNLTAGFRLTDALSFRARLENVFDEDYELADGYSTAGFGAFVSLRYAPPIGAGASVSETRNGAGGSVAENSGFRSRSTGTY
jgi:vitamin B12 transporter